MIEYKGKFKLVLSKEANPSLKAKLDIDGRRYPTAVEAHRDIPAIAGMYKLDPKHFDVGVHN